MWTIAVAKAKKSGHKLALGYDPAGGLYRRFRSPFSKSRQSKNTMNTIACRFTRRQVPRGALADFETHNRIYLIKNVSRLHVTYQVRLLQYKAHTHYRGIVELGRVPKVILTMAKGSSRALPPSRSFASRPASGC